MVAGSSPAGVANFFQASHRSGKTSNDPESISHLGGKPSSESLASNLHVYLEYSNETWNSGFLQNSQIESLAVAESAAETAAGIKGPLNFDGQTSKYYLTERYNAMRPK